MDNFSNENPAQKQESEARRAINSVENFPVGFFPDEVKAYVNEMARVYACPSEFIASAVLSTACAAIGKRIRLDAVNYSNYPALWIVLVARSGSNKSLPLRKVTEPLRKLDGDLFDSFCQRIDQWRRQPAATRGESPKCLSILVDDCTEEKRNEMLFNNPNGLLCVYPEMKGFFDDMNRYSSQGSAAVSRLLRIFDSQDIKVDRKGEAPMLIREPVLNILGDIQTGMLSDTFGSKAFMTNGLNQRFLFSVADTVEFPEYECRIISERYPNTWSSIVRRLSEAKALTGEFPDHGVRLSGDAIMAYIDYYNLLQDAKAKAADDYEISVYAKAQIQVLRIALILHALYGVSDSKYRTYCEIPVNVMHYATAMMNYYQNQAFKVYDILTAKRHPSPKAAESGYGRTYEAVMELLKGDPTLSTAELIDRTGCSRSTVCRIRRRLNLD